MSQGNNSPGISKLAGIMRQMVNNGRDTSLVLDFGVINGDYSLTTNTFPVAIPMGDYLVCRHLKDWTTQEVEDHKHHIQPHKHHIAPHLHHIAPHLHHIAPHLHHIAPHLHHIAPHLHHIAPHLHHIPLHTHTNEVSNVSLTTNAAGGHTHTLHDSGGTISGTYADSVADHVHTIEEHNHVVTIHQTEWDTENTEHDTENTEHDTENTEHDTENTEHDTENTEHNTENTEHDTEMTEHDTDLAGKHSHKFPDGWTLKRGDLVLVAWVQNDAVVVDVIISATQIFRVGEN